MKKGHSPVTKVKNLEPNIKSPDWVIWAAWADRITFEEIKQKTGMSESEVIKVMRRTLKPKSFKLWRKEFIQRVLNIEKNLNMKEKKLEIRKLVIIYKL